MNATTTLGPSAADLLDFATAIHGDQRGYLALLSGRRAPGRKDLADPRSTFYRYPDEIPAAAAWLRDQVTAGREAYCCAHLVSRRERKKFAALPVSSLWADADAGRAPSWLRPSVEVASSPRRRQLYVRLTRQVPPATA
jgi:hypothetical protein